MERLCSELAAYYATLSHTDSAAPYSTEIDAIWQEMDAYSLAHPDEPAVLLKAHLHEVVANRCHPVIFPHSPFFWEIGLRSAPNWGVGRGPSVGYWLRDRRQASWVDPSAARGLRHLAEIRISPVSYFDEDHRCPGYTCLLSEGILGLLVRLESRRLEPCSPEQLIFLEASERSCRAVLKIAAIFAERAGAYLAYESDPAVRRNLEMIVSAASHVPAQSPRTFFEGLASLWFLREITATLEGCGISVIGHPDKMLIDLYRADIKAGRLTEADARDLLARWLVVTDIRFNVHADPWPETSTCMELGGCDAQGKPLYNELTRLILEVHQQQGLLNPKPNCRFGAKAPQEYLDLISRQILAGHNVFALQNDDVLIPAQVRHGKTLADARGYVNGGCQETICEGVEHSAGAYYYLNLARVLDLFLLGDPPSLALVVTSPEAAAAIPTPVTTDDFESFYVGWIAALEGIIACGADLRTRTAAHWDEVNPCPFYSVTLAGCIEQARDFTTGSARYNPAGLAPVGFATVVDSLYAIKWAVFDEGWLSLEDLRIALRTNWLGMEALRARLANLPKFGQGVEVVDTLAARFCRDLAEITRRQPNERGGHFQPSLFVYYHYVWMAKDVRATPDGRRAGDLLSQGAGPSRLNPPKSLTDLIRSASRIDYTDLPGNAVLDLQLPLGGALQPEELVATMRTFASLGGPTLQFNCVSIDELRDAQLHPALHRDLQVRICGLSAYFVALEKGMQEEIIERTEMGG
ncbi:MAG: pyruvate formate lyase family protein [Anaerolineae bacterium]